jgi:predicted DNA-binding transcriptional regulator YafY
MRRADRLFHLVQVLRNRRFCTGDQLAEALGVSKRTVYRDVRDLQLSGIPIHGEAGVGYQLQRGFELPPLMFNAAEVEALVLGARVVETWGDPELAAAVRSAMAKVEEVLPEPLRRLLFDTPLYAPAGPRSRTLTQGPLSAVRRALADRRKLAIHYTRADGQQSKRVIRPLGLYFWGTSWSVAAWCELRRDYRNFRPDRMGEVRLLEDTFDGSDGISLAGFISAMERRAEKEGYPDEISGAGPPRRSRS